MRFLVLFFLAFSLHVSAAQAEYQRASLQDARSAIIAFNDKKVELINSPDFFYKATDFYHTHIDQNALFTIQINDTRTNTPQSNFQLDKVQFLQGFLKEGQRLSSYSQNYKVTQMSPLNQQDTYAVRESIIEQAVIPSLQPQKHGEIFFIAQTECTSFYKVQGNSAIQLGSECQTNVDYPEQI